MFLITFLRNAVIYSFENTDITISAQCQEDTVSIIFVTTAISLPEEKLNRIFEQFYRLDAARSTSSGGAGLGLAIVKQVVELHNGTIVAESQEDQNKFSITFRWRRKIVRICIEKKRKYLTSNQENTGFCFGTIKVSR